MKYTKTKTLTPAKQKFAQEFAKTDNATLAVKRAYPELAKAVEAEGRVDTVLRVKANRLLTNENVQQAIVSQKNKLATIANRAVQRVEQLVESDNEKIATANVWQVIDHVHGKAVQQIETSSTAITLNIDLSGSANSSTTSPEAL